MAKYEFTFVNLQEDIRSVVYENMYKKTTEPLQEDVKYLIESYCKKQREICFREWKKQRDELMDYDAETIAILTAKLATER